MLENVKIGDKVKINNGHVGEVVDLYRNGDVEIRAAWEGTSSREFSQTCKPDGSVYGYDDCVKEVL